MYIASMTIKNLRNVEFLDVHFSKLMNKISWKNWAWKSTLIDAIRFWILWKTYMWTWTSSELYITQGKEECEINIKIADEDRTIHVRRKVTKAWNVYLEAVDSNADKLWQKELSALLYTICIDPLEFTRKNTKEQFELVKQITWCDTSEIDEEIEWLLENRKIANAQLKANKSILESMWEPEKVERVDVSEAMKSLQEMQTFNRSIDEASSFIDMKKNTIYILNEKKKRLLQELDEVNIAIDSNQAEVNKVLLSEAWRSEKKDESYLKEVIWWADLQNQQAQKYQDYLKAKERVEADQKNYDDLDAWVEELRKSKDTMIKSAKMPIENMMFTEKDWIIINWIPFSQHSTWQQLIMACKIATFTNPDLKVIVIKDWSLLDDNSVDEVARFAEDNDYQVYMELVNEQAWTIIMREWQLDDQPL